MDPRVANVEAALNIFANVSEIAGIRYGLGLIIASVLISFLKKGSLALNHFVAGIALTVYALSIPAIVNGLVSWTVSADALWLLYAIAIAGGILGLATLLAALYFLFWPVQVASKRGKTKLGWIQILCAVGVFIGLLWSVALYLAYRDEPADADPESKNP